MTPRPDAPAPKGLRQSQAALHTWSALVVGWVLYAIFLNGTVSYWREELSRWARPEIGPTRQVERVLEGAAAYLERHAAGAESWSILLPNDRQTGAVVSWKAPKDKAAARHDGASATDTLIGPGGRPIEVRDTEGGDFFYRLHFDLHYMPAIWGRWIVGVCTMFMAVAIISGVITHKKIFADFFTFRPGKGQRSWLDGHNALAVLSLPFHAMITYTGLITLMTIYVPWGVMANYEGRTRFFSELSGLPRPEKAVGVSAPLYPISQAVKVAQDGWGGAAAGSVRVSNPGDVSARILVTRQADASLIDGGGAVVFDGVTGRRLTASPEATPAVATRGAMIGLHAGRFAPMTLRWFFFLSGLVGTAMAATGLILWTAKRREKLLDPSRPHPGFVLVEGLNIGFVAGLPLAMTGFLWANRLLPIGLTGRAAWEIHVMFIVWGLALVHAFTRKPRKAAWTEQLALTGGLLVLLPVFDLFATPAGLIRSAQAADWPVVGMNLGLITFGAAFLALALAVGRHRAAPPRLPARRPSQASGPATTGAAS